VCTHLGLGESADRQHGARQRVLIEHVDHVALILGGIGPAQETPRTVDLLDAGVMSGGHGVEAENVSALEESIELEMTVALDARIGCDPAGVIGDVRVDDVTMEIVGEVEDQMIDSELLGHAPRVVDIAHAAASGVTLTTPQAHGDTHDLMPLLEQKGSGDRRIDTSGHGDKYFHGVSPWVRLRRSSRRGVQRPLAAERIRSIALATTVAASSTSVSVVVCPSDMRRAP